MVYLFNSSDSWKHGNNFTCCCCCCLVAKSIELFATPWTIVCQAPLSVGFPRQEYWSGLPFPLSWDHPDPGIEPSSLMSPALAGRFFTTEWPGKPSNFTYLNINNQTQKECERNSICNTKWREWKWK